MFVQLYAKPKNRGWREAERLLGKFQGLFAKPLTQILRSDVVRVLDEIVASGTPYRANRALAALKKLMSWTLDRGMIDVNPISGLKPPHRERAREVILSDEEIRARYGSLPKWTRTTFRHGARAARAQLRTAKCSVPPTIAPKATDNMGVP